MITERATLVYDCKCDICGHEWTTLKVPLRCAGKTCKRPGWNKQEVQAQIDPKGKTSIFKVKLKELPKTFSGGSIREPFVYGTPETPDPVFEPDLMKKILDWKPQHSANCKCFICKPPKEGKKEGKEK